MITTIAYILIPIQIYNYTSKDISCDNINDINKNLLPHIEYGCENRNIDLIIIGNDLKIIASMHKNGTIKDCHGDIIAYLIPDLNNDKHIFVNNKNDNIAFILHNNKSDEYMNIFDSSNLNLIASIQYNNMTLKWSYNIYNDKHLISDLRILSIVIGKTHRDLFSIICHPNQKIIRLLVDIILLYFIIQMIIFCFFIGYQLLLCCIIHID